MQEINYEGHIPQTALPIGPSSLIRRPLQQTVPALYLCKTADIRISFCRKATL